VHTVYRIIDKDIFTLTRSSLKLESKAIEAILISTDTLSDI